MSKLCKHILSFVLLFILTVTSTLPVSATEFSSEASYDLQKGGTQSFYVENENGEINEIVIEEIPDKTRMDAGTYKVTYNTLGWTTGFYVIIVNDKMEAAHSPFYTVTNGSISNTSLLRNSPTKVTYAFLYRSELLTFDTGVIATISNSKLVISKK